MSQTYLMSYIEEHDYTKTVRFKVVSHLANATWRELQEKFDPGYHYDSLKFYYLGGLVK